MPAPEARARLDPQVTKGSGMTTEGIREADDHAPGVRSSWYVALAQLPGLPVKLRLEVVAIVSAALKALPVLARRDHFWSGSAHALA